MSNAFAVEYRDNRSRFPLDELRKFDGQWVAFSADGLRIVAGGMSLADLSAKVRAADVEMQDVILEHIDFDADEINLGGAELL